MNFVKNVWVLCQHLNAISVLYMVSSEIEESLKHPLFSTPKKHIKNAHPTLVLFQTLIFKK
jgi:hypothetical protein